MRMGLHRHTGRADAAFQQYVEAVRPPFVKMLDPGADANALALWCTARGVATIGRNVFGSGEQELSGTKVSAAVATVVRLATANRGIKYWELFNEAFDEPGAMARYSDASVTFMQAMEAVGCKAVIGCFSQGTPEVTGPDPQQEWQEYLPALRYAIEHGHILGLHEYSGPFMNYEETWHCLRYRRSLDVLHMLGLDVSRLQIAITESGIDDVWGRPGPQGKGYKPFAGSEWSRPPASVHGDYAGQLLWYGQELSKDPQVVGWVDFGWADGSGDWGDFDLSTDPPMLARVATLQKQLPGVSVPTPPQEVKMLQGVDVSRWQGVMNWSTAASAGVQFAFIKATEGGDWLDPQFSRNATGAKAAGIPWGPYHYYRTSVDPIIQARHFNRVVSNFPFDLPPALDLEDYNPPLDETAFARFVREVERLMGKPMIYTASWYMNSYVDQDVSWLAGYPLWQAAYVTGQPPVCRPWQGWTVWQYTSKGPGPVMGAQSAYIDRNTFRGTMQELLALKAPPVHVPEHPDINWSALLAHAEHEQEVRGVHMNPASALLAAIRNDDLEVVLGETSFDDAGTNRVYAVGESFAADRKAVYVWDAFKGAVVKRQVRG